MVKWIRTPIGGCDLGFPKILPGKSQILGALGHLPERDSVPTTPRHGPPDGLVGKHVAEATAPLGIPPARLDVMSRKISRTAVHTPLALK